MLQLGNKRPSNNYYNVTVCGLLIYDLATYVTDFFL